MFDAFETDKKIRKALRREDREYRKVEKMIAKKEAKKLENWLKRFSKKGVWW